MSSREILMTSIRYGNVNQTLMYMNRVNPHNTMFEAGMFKYNVFELIFQWGTPEMITRIIDHPRFLEIDPCGKYTGQIEKSHGTDDTKEINDEMYKSISAYYMNTLTWRITNDQDYENILDLTQIFCKLLSRGFMTEESVNAILSYVRQKRIPKWIRCIIIVLIHVQRKKRLDIISSFFPRGVDGMISGYID